MLWHSHGIRKTGDVEQVAIDLPAGATCIGTAVRRLILAAAAVLVLWFLLMCPSLRSFFHEVLTPQHVSLTHTVSIQPQI